jgi:hypothetical protein
MLNTAHSNPDSSIDVLREPCPTRANEVRLPPTLIEEIEQERVRDHVRSIEIARADATETP